MKTASRNPTKKCGYGSRRTNPSLLRKKRQMENHFENYFEKGKNHRFTVKQLEAANMVVELEIQTELDNMGVSPSPSSVLGMEICRKSLCRFRNKNDDETRTALASYIATEHKHSGDEFAKLFDQFRTIFPGTARSNGEFIKLFGKYSTGVSRTRRAK